MTAKFAYVDTPCFHDGARSTKPKRRLRARLVLPVPRDEVRREGVDVAVVRTPERRLRQRRARQRAGGRGADWLSALIFLLIV